MALKKIVKIILAVVMCIGVAACSSGSDNDENEPVKILCPTGAPGLSLLGIKDNEYVTIDFVEGTDVLTAELAKEDSEYDIIIAPTNLGVKMYENAPYYNLEAVLTWGNLYVVGKEDLDLDSITVAAFGENAVPGMVFKDVYDTEAMNITWFNSVQEAQQALLTGQVDAALLAEPAATAAIQKAEEQGLSLSILSDIQELWQAKNNMDFKGFPQSSLFVKKDSRKKVAPVLEAIESFLVTIDEDNIAKKIQAIGIDDLGLPSEQIAAKTWKKQNIDYVSAEDAKEDIEAFLAVFNMELPDGLIVEEK